MIIIIDQEDFAEFEGGGSRCFFTLGVLQTLIEEKIRFTGFAGISAGAICSLLAFNEKIKDITENLDELEKKFKCNKIRKRYK